MVINNPNIKVEDLLSITRFTCGAAPLGASDVERFQEKTSGKININQAYGMTETGPLTTIQTRLIENGQKIGGCGLLIPNTQAKILATDTGTTLGPNESGELVIKGPQVISS